MMVPGGQTGKSLWNTWTEKELPKKRRNLKSARLMFEFLTIDHLAEEKAEICLVVKEITRTWSHNDGGRQSGIS